MTEPVKTILIVDDEQSYLDIIANTLKDKNFRVLQALNGRMGCRVAERFLPDIIVMDWEMPEMNGIQAIEYLKQQDATKDIPIIMATGVMTAVENLQTALKAGAVDYVRKPIDPIEIVARISTMLKLADSYKEIKLKNEILADLNREKDGLVSVVAHDLRAPLNRVKGLAELISYGENLTEDQRNYLKIMNKTCESGFVLIRDLLDINQVQHQDSEINIEKLDLPIFLNDLLKNYEPQASAKQIKLHYTADAHLDLWTDEYFLTRILDNLLSNAIKFTFSDKNIYVKVIDLGLFAEITIQDEGQGFTEEDKQKMFKRFQKLSAKPTAGENSTGLGLAIVKALVEKLHGTISMEGEPNKGATFTIHLPKTFEGNAMES